MTYISWSSDFAYLMGEHHSWYNGLVWHSIYRSVTYILWSSDFASYLEDYLMKKRCTCDNGSLWLKDRPCKINVGQWPIFHGPLILPYIIVRLKVFYILRNGTGGGYSCPSGHLLQFSIIIPVISPSFMPLGCCFTISSNFLWKSEPNPEIWAENSENFNKVGDVSCPGTEKQMLVMCACGLRTSCLCVMNI